MDSQIIKVVRQIVNGGQPVYIGVENDNAVRSLIFTGLPTLGDNQLVTLYWTLQDGSLDNLTELTLGDDGYTWVVDANITQHGAMDVEAYITISLSGPVWHTKKFKLNTSALPHAAEGTSLVNPTIYGQMVENIAENRAAITAIQAAVAADREQTDLDAIATAADRLVVAQDKATVAQDKTTVAGSLQTAIDKAVEAYNSALAAGESRDQAAQALSDLLNLRGTDFAPLVGGLIPIEYLNARLIVKVRVRDSEAAMLALEAEEADVCIRSDEAKTYVMDETLTWVHMPSPTNYADTAGYAATAGEAGNADTINGHRIVMFDTVAEMESAVKVAGTLYFAPYEEV